MAAYGVNLNVGNERAAFLMIFVGPNMPYLRSAECLTPLQWGCAESLAILGLPLGTDRRDR